jgi:hypothetical protein
MDHTENTSPNSSIVAARRCRTGRVENTPSQLLHWPLQLLRSCCLQSHYLATELHATDEFHFVLFWVELMNEPFIHRVLAPSDLFYSSVPEDQPDKHVFRSLQSSERPLLARRREMNWGINYSRTVAANDVSPLNLSRREDGIYYWDCSSLLAGKH